MRSTELLCRPLRGSGFLGSVFPGLTPRAKFWRPLWGLGCWAGFLLWDGLPAVGRASCRECVERPACLGRQDVCPTTSGSAGFQPAWAVGSLPTVAFRRGRDAAWHFVRPTYNPGMHELPQNAEVSWPPSPAEGQSCVAFEVRMTPGLLGRELSALNLRRYWVWSLMLFLVFLALEALKVEDWSHPDPFDLLFWPVSGAGFIALYFFVAGRLSARKVFQTTPLWQHPIRVIVTPTRVFTSGPGFESGQDLALLHAVLETRESFLVYLNAVYILIWPKRSLPDRESLQRLREYLRQGMPGTARIRLRSD